MRTVRTAVCAAALLAACGRDSDSRNVQEAAAADSAGWRLATAAGGHLRLRYPEALIHGVVDRWTGTCEPSVSVNVEDTLLLDRLVIAGASAGTLDSIAPALGFQWHADGWWLEPVESGWTGGLRADTIAAGAWRALYGEVGMKVITGDEPPAEDGQRVMHTDVVQNRFVAVGPAIEGCHVVLFWWGGERVGPSLLRHVLANARLIDR